MSTPTPAHSPTSSPTKRAPSCGPTPANSPTKATRPDWASTPVDTPATSPTKPIRTAAAPALNGAPARGSRSPALSSTLAGPEPGRVAPPPTPSSSPTRRPSIPRPAPPPSPPPPTPSKLWKQGVKSDEAILMARKHFGAQWEGTTQERLRSIEAKRHRRWLGATGRPAVPGKRRRDHGDKVFLRGAIEGWRQQRLREASTDKEVSDRMSELDLMAR
ncbi:hypothetical protein PspLS_09666 [Pyricularia sp. CBS 133598]|nr:hypothetical protein PspLS_09666 [Pyricularia sp. CBS 133598]